MEHYRILYRDNQLTIDEEGFFRNLDELVKVKETKLVIVNGAFLSVLDGCMLKFRVRKRRSFCSLQWMVCSSFGPVSDTKGTTLCLSATALELNTTV